MPFRRSYVPILFLVWLACIGCRHKEQRVSPQTIPTAQPATAPAGRYRVAREGIALTLDLMPEVRWSAHAVLRLRNESDGPVHVMRHAGSILHDYHLTVRRPNGEEVSTRMMLKPGEPGRATRLVLEPGEGHEEGVQLGMLFALREGERYVLTVRVAVHQPGKPKPMVLEIRDAGFTVVAD
jgi:hypothetical protein